MNPNGRPPGKGAAAVARAEFRLGGKLKTLIDKLYDLAIAGDMSAARLLLERTVPAYRPHAMPMSVPLPSGSLTDQAKALLAAAAAGDLPADIASELLTAAAKVVTIEQADELRRRLDELEHGDIA